jgi:drug/metabolite transporter (DMT)-like permease
MLSVALAVLAAASNACSSVLQREANKREVDAQRSGVAGLVHLLRQPLWLWGIAAVILSFLLQGAALDLGQLAEVQPLLSLELPMTLLLASRVFHRRMSRRTWADIVTMSAGMALFLVALSPSGGDPTSPDGRAWASASGVTGGVVVVLVVAGWRTRGASRAALLGVASGVSFALTAMFMDGTLGAGLSWDVFTRWQTYLVVAAGLTAMAVLQEALRAGSLVVVQPGVTLADPVVAVLLGALLFDEHLRVGPWLVAELAGAAAVAWGAIRLSRSPVVNEDDAAGAGDRDASGREPARTDAGGQVG